MSFELLREETVHEINSRARLYRHTKSGAQFLSLSNEDENKVFGVNFATPPADSTGIAHIMEHSVLCGSRSYPSKEPFIELAKGSLNTFLNAMTYSDKTVYPVASQNAQDLYNLADVYLDAVFHPNITEWTLRQEGWHYELGDAADEMTYKGVVFNEMKGAYSSPERRLYKAIGAALFPDTPYGVDSGGDPQVIPDLTYAQFKSFHETYYHPSNALIWWYGDDPEDERLRRLDAVLSEFDARPIDARMPLQPRFSAPRRVQAAYPIDAANAATAKNYVAVNWLLTDVLDERTALALDILGSILMSTPASPLRKALIESGLGEDVLGGMDDSQREITFGAGLKGVAAENVAAVEALVLDTLRRLAANGIEPEMIEAVLNTVEFRLRELNTGGTPRGLALMLASLQTWLHGGDPLSPLRFEAPLAELKARLAAGERVFEELITAQLLRNDHRVTAVLAPDAELRAREEQQERARLAAARAAMTPVDIERIVAQTRELRRMQETPDSPEALASIPGLTLADLDRKNKTAPTAVLDGSPARVLHHDLFTNGIAYLDVGFDMRAVDAADVPLLSLFGQMFLGMGTADEDYARLSQRIGRKTGGLRSAMLNGVTRGSGDAASWFFLRGKATMAQVDDLLAILGDVLLGARLDNRERFKQIVLEEKAGLEARLAPAGHSMTNMRLRAAFTSSDWAIEQMGGASYLFFLRDLAQRIESDWPGVLAQLERVRAALVNRSSALCNVTLDAANWAAVQPRFDALLARLPDASARRCDWPTAQLPAHEGLTIQAQVNYVGKAANLFAHGYAMHGSALVVNNYLNTSWLWERVRVQGGAYGGFARFDVRSGVFTYLSYRDPNLAGTLAVYDRTSDHLREHEISDDEVRKCIIGVIGDLDAHELPDARGYSAATRFLLGTTDDVRQQMRDEILATTAADFRRFADALDAVRAHGRVAVFGSANAIEAANAELAQKLTVTKVL
jgi:Zn-dependent M16 (insulinase) family peptidase